MRTFCLSLKALAILVAGIGPVAADDLTEEARAAIVAFTQAVHDGPEATAAMLAPEYQIMRANGVGFDRDGYIEAGVGQVSAQPNFSHEDIVATMADDVMVVRYFLRVNETIGGAPVTRRAPRLTVFRKIDGAWMVVSHANFGAIWPPR